MHKIQQKALAQKQDPSPALAAQRAPLGGENFLIGADAAQNAVSAPNPKSRQDTLRNRHESILILRKRMIAFFYDMDR